MNAICFGRRTSSTELAKDPSIGHLVDLRETATAFCERTRADYDGNLDTLSWQILPQLRLRAQSPLSKMFDFISCKTTDLLAAATHLNNVPLVKSLLDDEA